MGKSGKWFLGNGKLSLGFFGSHERFKVWKWGSLSISLCGQTSDQKRFFNGPKESPVSYILSSWCIPNTKLATSAFPPPSLLLCVISQKGSLSKISIVLYTYTRMDTPGNPGSEWCLYCEGPWVTLLIILAPRYKAVFGIQDMVQRCKWNSWNSIVG